jgi:rubredoxin
MQKFKCSVCGYVYDETAGVSQKGVAPGTKWEEIPDSFACPVCTAPKSVFGLVEATEQPVEAKTTVAVAFDKLRQLDGDNAAEFVEATVGEIAAICSSLAKGCEKQRLMDEMEAFSKIADYFKSKAIAEKGKTLEDVAKMLIDDMATGYPAANKAAKDEADRGAQRSLVWSEKVSILAKSLLERFAKEGEAMLENTGIFVCDICGFIYTGDAQPEICPICKVQSYKIIPVERR